MSSKFVFELNWSGVNQLLKSHEMQNGLMQYAEFIKNQTGAPDNYYTSPYTGKNRTNVSISTANRKAMQDNLDNNTLLKALGSARKG